MNAGRLRGVTLIELLVALSILAVLMALGIPSFQQWLLNTRVRSAAESIQNGLRFARNEAAQRSTNVVFTLTNGNMPSWMVCMPSSGSTCPASGSSVLQTYTSSNSAVGVTITTSTTAADATAGHASNAVSGSAGSVVFNSLARPATYGGTSIVRIDAYTSSTNTADVHRLVTTISPGGEVNMCDAMVPKFSSTNTMGCP